MKKSITIADSLRTSVKPIQEKIFADSIVLGSIGNTTLPGKLTNVPFTQIPTSGQTAYVVGGLEVTKVLYNTTADITEETMEDAAIAVDASLEDSVTAQIRLQLEEKLVTDIKALSATVLVDAPDVRTTIIKLLTKFNPNVFTISMMTTVLVSYASYFELAFQGDPLTKQPNLKIVPCSSLLDVDVVILHAHGAVIGYDIKGVEVDRLAGKGAQSISIQGTLGTAFSADYVKRAVY
jgi:hypothetical protein